MEEIYSKIQLTQDYLHSLRIKLQEAEVEYETRAKKTVIPSTLAAVTLPFVEASCASARAAAISGGVRLR